MKREDMKREDDDPMRDSPRGKSRQTADMTGTGLRLELIGMTPPRVPLVSWGLLVLTGVYFLAGKFGLSLAFVHASASAVWPPTGIALAATLLLGYRVWPALFLGAFLVNVTTAGSVWTSLGIAGADPLGAGSDGASDAGAGSGAPPAARLGAPGWRGRVRRPGVTVGVELSPRVSVHPAARRGGVPVRPARGGDVRRAALGARELGDAARPGALRPVHAERVAAAAPDVHGDDGDDDAAPGGERQGARADRGGAGPRRRDRGVLRRRDHRQDAGRDHHDLERGRRAALRVRGARGHGAPDLDRHPAAGRG